MVRISTRMVRSRDGDDVRVNEDEVHRWTEHGYVLLEEPQAATVSSHSKEPEPEPEPEAEAEDSPMVSKELKGPGSRREGGIPVPTGDLEEMTVADLLAYSASRGIVLPSSTRKKTDVVAAIRAAEGGGET